MTIPSTGPLRPRELYVRRDRRPDWLLGVAGVLTLVVVVLSLVAVTADEPVSDRMLSLLGLLTSLVVFAIIGALWLLRPRTLPTIQQPPQMPSAGPPGRASVSPDKPRGSWPWS